MSESQAAEVIVLVENDSTWAASFVEILKALGETRRVDIVGIDKFLREYARAADFDKVAICLVDLELRGGVTAKLADKDGLNIVLPHVRAVAPWVPAACISRYISGSDEIIAELSCSDFDAFFPKAIVGDAEKIHSEFNTKRWRSIVADMCFRRTATQTGRSVSDLKTGLGTLAQMDMDQKTEAALKRFEISSVHLQEALSLMGIGGTEHTLSAMEPGFSGIQVTKIRVCGFDKDESINSTWLLKWGRPTRKLAEEASAHRLFMKRGIQRTLQIPQFHSNVIAWNSVGYLVYAFEEDATTALSFFDRHGSEGLRKSMASLCNGLYRDKRRRAINLRRSLEEWFPAQKDGADLNAKQDKSVEVSWALVHGDLHLRNVFIRNDEATLIDFARADFGPVAVDAAKFIADCLFMGQQELTQAVSSLSWAEMERIGLKPILDAFKPWMTEVDDVPVFEAMLRAYIARYVDYPDVSAERKLALNALLN